MYTISLTPAANKELQRLAQAIDRITAAIDELAQDPRPVGSVKLKGSEDTYRIRLGQYRVIYVVDDETRTVVVTRIRHRKDAYRD